MPLEELMFESVNGRRDEQTDGQQAKSDHYIVHPVFGSGELKHKLAMNLPAESMINDSNVYSVPSSESLSLEP